MRKSLIAIALFGLFALVSRAAYLESDVDDAGARIEPEPPRRIIPPRPHPDSPLIPLVRRVRVGTPTSRYGLTFFPLVLDRGVSNSEVLTLDEAIDRDSLRITETGPGQVPRVRVRNDARQPVFMMAGEIIVGGKQNRIIRDDVLLPAESGFVEVPVYCGEQDRWTEDKTGFKSGGLTAPSLRKMAAGSASQGQIWREIEGQLDRAEVRSSTRNYQQIYDDESTQRRLDECVSGLRRFCRRDTVGCVAVSRGRILGADLFSDRDLFERLWEKICRSYAAEGVIPYRGEKGGRRHVAIPDAAVIRRFLDAVLSARFSESQSPGIGRHQRLTGSASGHVLEFRGSVLHAGIFPERHWIRPFKEEEGGRRE